MFCLGWLLFLGITRLPTAAETPPPPADTPAASPALPGKNPAVEREFQRLLERDQDALDQVDQWILEERRLADRGAEMSSPALEARIEERLKPIEEGYREFLQRHPDHLRARLALGSLLNEMGREDDAVAEWEKARKQAPRDPVAWNNLANHYAQRGPVTKAFAYYERAIRLKPDEPLYRRNLARVVFLFRPEAREYYHLADEQAVLRKALEFYQAARKRDPQNFSLATDLAQVYYFLRPRNPDDPEAARKLTEAALAAWRAARKLAPNDLTRQGVDLHLARVCLLAGRREEARKHLARVTSPAYASVKKPLEQRLRPPAAAAPPAPASPKPAAP